MTQQSRHDSNYTHRSYSRKEENQNDYTRKEYNTEENLITITVTTIMLRQPHTKEDTEILTVVEIRIEERILT